MTDEQIAKLYDQALVIENNGDYVAGELDPVKFAKLVAQHEREACAKVCETLGVHPALNVHNGGPDWYIHGKDCAKKIRARGEE